LVTFADSALEVSLQRNYLEVNRFISAEAKRFPDIAKAAWDREQVGIRRLAKFIDEYAAIDRIKCSDSHKVSQTFIEMPRGYYMQTLANRVISGKERTAWATHTAETIFSSRRASWQALPGPRAHLSSASVSIPLNQ
jgi:hypothetical protein